MSDSDPATRSFHQTTSAYPLPNDATEHERLFLQTQAINRLMHDQPVRAPVKNPRRILEIGAGTGHMTNYFAEKFPDATEVIGLDLSPVPQPPARPGVKFIQGDFWELATDPNNETLKAGSFDYIFSRMLLFGMKNWPGYIARAKELLAPGGWLEIQDLDFEWRDSDLNSLVSDVSWYKDYQAGFLKNGLDIHAPRKFEGYVRDAKFEDVQVEKFRWVYGKWHGHPETDMMGQYATKYLGGANEVAYRRVLGPLKSKEELEKDLKDIEWFVSYDETGRHQTCFVVCAKKP